MQLRNEKTTDKTAITAVLFAAFTDHPKHVQGAEPTEHPIVERLRAAGALTLSLVAEEGETSSGTSPFLRRTVAQGSRQKRRRRRHR